MTQRSEQADRVLDLARKEADLLGHRYLGPEHLVLGVLREGGSGASQILEASGVNLAAARVELRRLAERGLVPGPRPSDAELLGLLGIDLAAIRRTTEQTFGGKALGWAIREATRARRGGVGRVPRTPLRDPPMLITQVPPSTGSSPDACSSGAPTTGKTAARLSPRRANPPGHRPLHRSGRGSPAWALTATRAAGDLAAPAADHS